MACPSCNAHLDADARFCLACGHRLHQARPGTRQVRPPPPGLAAGKTLHQLIVDAAPVDWRRGFAILGEVCRALAGVHARGRRHLDLLPEDVYLEDRPGTVGVVRFVDTGRADLHAGGPEDTERTGRLTSPEGLEYRSPEQLMGKPLDERSDIYTLGVLAYELVTGQLPFPDAKGPAGVITAQLKQRPQAPSAVHAPGGIPRDVDAVLLRCLEKDRDHRYPDVTALARAVSEVLQT